MTDALHSHAPADLDALPPLRGSATAPAAVGARAAVADSTTIRAAGPSHAAPARAEAGARSPTTRRDEANSLKTTVDLLLAEVDAHGPPRAAAVPPTSARECAGEFCANETEPCAACVETRAVLKGLELGRSATLPALPAPAPRAAAASAPSAAGERSVSTTSTTFSGERAASTSSEGISCSLFGPSTREYTREEVARHNSEESCWIIAHGFVYDVTPFLSMHPAGAKSILRHAGTDATEDFDFHDCKSQKLWTRYCIGRLVAAERPSSCVIA